MVLAKDAVRVENVSVLFNLNKEKVDNIKITRNAKDNSKYKNGNNSVYRKHCLRYAWG